VDPTAEADADGEEHAEWMQEAPKPGGAHADGEDDADEVDEGDLGKGDRKLGGDQQEDEREEELDELRGADEAVQGEVALERGADVLGEAVANLDKAVIHAAIGKPGGVAIDKAHALRDAAGDFAAEGQILDDVIVDCLVAADALIGGATEEEELAVRGAQCAKETFRQTRRERDAGLDKLDKPLGRPREGDDVEDGDDHFLAKADGDEAGPGGKEIGAGVMRHGEGGGDGGGGMDGIGIGEDEPMAGGDLGELVAGPVFADPAVRQGGAGEEAVTGVRGKEFRGYGAGTVRGGVVKDDEFEVRVILGDEGGEALGDGALFIAGGDENRDGAGGGWSGGYRE